jgi:hypothetical protein
VDLSTSAGMNSWAVEGLNQLNQQWFWYRVGSGVAQPINVIGNMSYSTTGTSGLTVTYSNALFNLSVDYLLAGGSVGSGSADIQESIKVHNNSGSSLSDFHLYQYSDFNLLDDPNADTVQIYGDTIDGYTFAYQYKGLTQIAEAINLPPGSHAEASTTPNTLNNLTTADYVLNDVTFAGPGDVTWALQWDPDPIGAGMDFDVFKNKVLSIEPIPEPSVTALVVLGLGVWGFARRRE